MPEYYAASADEETCRILSFILVPTGPLPSNLSFNQAQPETQLPQKKTLKRFCKPIMYATFPLGCRPMAAFLPVKEPGFLYTLEARFSYAGPSICHREQAWCDQMVQRPEKGNVGREYPLLSSAPWMILRKMRFISHEWTWNSGWPDFEKLTICFVFKMSFSFMEKFQVRDYVNARDGNIPKGKII